MPTPLRVLLLEDRPSDAELLLYELRRAGFDVTSQRVDQEEDYLAALDPSLDIILADYTLPQFDGLTALRHLQGRGLDIPFIAVTGMQSEEAAVQCMREGASDYLLKDRLGRLGQAVSHALAEKQVRAQKHEAEAALRESEARYRTISELSSDFAYALTLQLDRTFVCEWITDAFTRITGYSQAELGPLGGWWALAHPDDRSIVAEHAETLQVGEAHVAEFRILTKDGETRFLRDRSRPVWDADQIRVTCVYGAAEDITERHRAEEERLHLLDQAQARAQAFGALHEVSVAAGGVLDPAALARLVVERTRVLLGGDSAGLYWWIGDANILEPLWDDDAELAVTTQRISRGEGATGQAFQRGEPVVVANYRDWERAIQWMNGVQPFASVAAVPLLVNDRAVGALNVRSHAPRHFGPEEVQLLSLLAAQVGPVLEAARLHTESERRRAEAEALAELARRGVVEGDTDRVMDLVAEQACRLLDASYAGVALPTEDGQVRLRSLSGSRSADWRALSGRAPQGKSSSARAVAAGRTLLIERLGENPEYPIEEFPLHQAEGGRTVLTTPMFGRGRTLGALMLAWRSDVRITSAQMRLVEALASYAATVIENAGAHAREQQLARAAAAAAAQRATVIEQMPDGVIVLDATGRLVIMNQTARSVWNRRLDPTQPLVTQGGSSVMLDPVSRQRIPRADMPIPRALAGEAVRGREYILVRPGLPDRWLQLSAVPLRDPAGQMAGVVVVQSDVTEERRLVRDLAVSEERLRTLYEALTCGVLVRDVADGVVTHANKMAAEILGVPVEQLLGQTLGSAFQATREDGTPLPIEGRTEILRRVMESRAPVRGSTRRVMRPDGEERWVQIDIVPVLDADGAISQMVSSFIDITERKRAEEARARLAAILEATPDLVSITDVRGRRLYLNWAGRQMLGIGADEDVSNMTMFGCAPERAQAMLRDEAIPTAIREGVWSGELVLLSRDSREIPVSQVLLAQRRPDGTVEYLASIARDMTERKRVEEERLHLLTLEQAARARLEETNRALERATQAKSEFLATMSHELRTPLNSIIGFSELLLDEEPHDPESTQRRRFAENIHVSGQYLLNLVNDILDLAKVEAGRMEVYPAWFEVTTSLQAVAAGIRPLAEKKRISFATQVDPRVPTVYADERKFKQVLYNLLSNAVKFSPEGARVETTVRLVEDAIEVVVADTGIGIAHENQERIFEAFQQLDSSAARHHEGTGLGLALTRRLVELQGGRVWVESTPGEGSRFGFSIPTRTASAAAAVGAGAPGGPDAADDVSGYGLNTPVATPPSGAAVDSGWTRQPQGTADGRVRGRPLILLVGSEAHASALLCTQLERAGYCAAAVAENAGALEQARALHPVAILVDAQRDGRANGELLEALQAEPATVGTPVLAMSVGRRSVAGTAPTAGQTPRLVAPDELVQVLHQLVAAHAAADTAGVSDS
jgi:PAS domain S-box-containing protein